MSASASVAPRRRLVRGAPRRRAGRGRSIRVALRSRALLAATWALLAGACTPQASDSTAEQASELAVRTLMAAWERADTALIEELFWPQATYDDFPNQITYQGVAEIVDYVTSAHRWGDDVYMNVGQVHASATGAVAEWVFSAVQNRPLGDALTEGTGREVVLNGVTIIELDGDRITRAADYTDTTPMWLQLGARIELPGGAVIELDGIGN